jgi:hypothetical protein
MHTDGIGGTGGYTPPPTGWEPLAVIAPLILLSLIGFTVEGQVLGRPVYVWLGLTITLFGLMVAVWLLRDLRSWRSVAWLQVAVSIAVGLTSLMLAQSVWQGVLGFIAAVFTGNCSQAFVGDTSSQQEAN